MTGRRGRPRAAVRLLFYGLVPVIAVLALAGYRLSLTLPAVDGEHHVAGLRAAVSIERDTHGFVTIGATSDDDAFFATGFVHAQDRLWQLEIQRRIANGTLSEVFGADALPEDVWMRNFQFTDRAREDFDTLGEAARRSLSAYAAGINAGRRSLARLPIEFSLYGVEPRPWTEADSLAWVKVFAMNLAGNLSREVRNHLAAEHLDDAQRRRLREDTTDDYSTIADDEYRAAVQQHGRLLELDRAAGRLPLDGLVAGSNAWAVSGAHTASGQPMLANDPHLTLQIPGLWYALSQRGDRLRSTGMSLVGTPLVVFGHNGAIAWAGTNLMADVQDLALEQVDPADPNRYLRDGQWLAFSRRTERFDIRARFPAFMNRTPPPIEVTYKSTVAGPVLATHRAFFDYPVSLRWTALERNDRSYEAFFDANYAQDWPAFLRAFSRLGSPAMNLVYADAAGNIGYTAAGSVPRRQGHDGSRPTPAWIAANGWHGHVPPEVLPQVFNPPKGYIVNANNRVIGDAYPYFISADWAPSFRARRIAALIDARIAGGGRILLDDMAAMQHDTLDLSAAVLRDRLVAAFAPEDAPGRHLLDLLREWNGDMRADSNAAALFAVWTDELRTALFLRRPSGYRESGNAEDLRRSVAENASTVQVAAALGEAGCAPPDLSSDCRALLRETLDASVRRLRKTLGRDPDDWTLAGLQEARYPNLLRVEDGLIGRLFGRRAPAHGAPNTIDVSDLRPDDAGGYRKTFGAGFRHVIGIGGGTPAYRYLLATGQSGNPVSAHYDDMLGPFESGGRLLDPSSPAAASTLTLLPQAAADAKE